MGAEMQTEPFLTIIVRFVLRPGARDDFLPALRGLADNLSRDAAFVEGRIHIDTDRPNDVVFYETWRETKHAFLDRVPHHDWFQDFVARLPDWLAEERQVSWLERTDVVPARHEAAR